MLASRSAARAGGFGEGSGAASSWQREDKRDAADTTDLGQKGTLEGEKGDKKSRFTYRRARVRSASTGPRSSEEETREILLSKGRVPFSSGEGSVAGHKGGDGEPLASEPPRPGVSRNPVASEGGGSRSGLAPEGDVGTSTRPERASFAWAERQRAGREGGDALFVAASMASLRASRSLHLAVRSIAA